MGELASGTVTFVLTDVEGSTRLWEEHPAIAEAAIRRSRALIVRSVEACGGECPIEQGEGDSTVSVFARAIDAVRAAHEAQVALGEEPWPAGASVRVRMAVHTGDATPAGDGTYAGPVLHRCARLRALAHGGQVVVSDVVGRLVADGLGSLALVDLGEHRLRDLSRAERVWQLAGPGLESQFPPLRSLDALPNNLPVQLSSFVGREAELAQVVGLLGRARLVTITGSGGCGKTRLAQRVAADVISDHPGGVWWVELAALRDGSAASAAVATAMGLRVPPDRTPIDAVIDHLADQAALIVLDNCEHLVAGAAALAHELVRRGSAITVLATSREPLAVEGEVTWRVPSLAVPPGDVDATALDRYGASQLFMERALQALPTFLVDDDVAPVVAQISAQLDGIPLAIELAAARVRSLSPRRIASQLDHRFRLLSGGNRTAMARQQTLYASVDWSHDLLDDHERVVFRRLACFAGGFTLEAAEHVVADETIDEYEVLDVVARLVDKSLVQLSDERGGGRYRMLQTIRHYALDRLSADADAPALRACHAAWVVELTAAHGAGCRNGNVVDLSAIETEHDNVLAALDWALECGHRATAGQIIVNCHHYWIFRARCTEAIAYAERVLAAAGVMAPPLALRVRWAQLHNLWHRGEVLRVAELAPPMEADAEAMGDLDCLANVTLLRSGCLAALDPAESVACAELAWERAKRTGDEVLEAATALGVGAFAALYGDVRRADLAFGRARDVYARTSNDAQLIHVEAAAARAAFRRGDSVEAVRLVTWALERAEHLDLVYAQSSAAETWARLCADLGRLEEIAPLLARVDRHRATLGGRWEQPSRYYEVAQQLHAAPRLVANELCAEGDRAGKRGDLQMACYCWEVAGKAAIDAGDFALALEQGERRHRLDPRLVLQRSRLQLVEAEARRLLGDPSAGALAHDTLGDLAHWISVADVEQALALVGGIAVDRGAAPEGLALLAAAEAARLRLGRTRRPAEQQRYDADVAAARAALDADRADADVIWAEGLTLTLDEAVELAQPASPS